MIRFFNLFSKKPVELAPMESAPMKVELNANVVRSFGNNFHLVTCTNRDVMNRIGYNSLDPNRSDFRCSVDCIERNGRKVLRINAIDKIGGSKALIHTSSVNQIQEMPGFGWSFCTLNTTYVFAYAEAQNAESNKSTAIFANDLIRKGGVLSF